MIQTLRTVAQLDLTVLSALQLAVAIGAAAWLMHGLQRAARQYVRAGSMAAAGARRLMLRGLFGVAAYMTSVATVHLVWWLRAFAR